MAKFGLMANMQTDEKNSLDIFEMSTGTNEPTKEVVNKKLLMLRRFQVNIKDIKCPLEWWAKHKLYFQLWHFLLVKFLALLVLK
jgi:hypothetical protein